MRLLLAATARDDSPKNIRDAAIISLGFAGAFRRSELSALDIADLKWTVRSSEEILILNVRRSKTDQEAQGMQKAIFPGRDEAVSPTSLLKKWLSLVELQEGPLFRRVLKSGQITGKRLSAQSMRLVVLQAASAASVAG